VETNRVNRSRRQAADPALRPERPAVFGLRYLEEEAAEIHDVVGCMIGTSTLTGCDDHDQIV